LSDIMPTSGKAASRGGFWRLALLLLTLAAFLGGAVAVEQLAIDRLLHEDAVATGQAWTAVLADNTADLAAIAAGEPPSQETRKFLARVKTVGRVFLYKIYDASGVPRFVSDDLPEEADDEEDLAAHNPEAAEAIAAGGPTAEVKTGEPPGRPAFYAETYIPAFDARGRIVAVVESYVDQTGKRGQFQSVFAAATSALAALIILAFGVPAAAWYFRKRAQEKAEADLKFLAAYDPLSGLANRATLVEGLMAALADAPMRDRSLAVHCVNIDRFKDINDTLGLEAADMLLRLVADRLTAIAAPHDVVARLSADEFVVVQADIGERSEAEAFAARIAQEVAQPLTINGEEIAVTVGIGIAIAPEHGRDAERLLKSAMLALAKGKEDGRAQIRFFSTDLDNELYRRLKLERTIDLALAQRRFVVHFQPQYSPDGKKLAGFEALARLPTGDGSFIPPTDFVPAAERMGVISALGAWILEEACMAAAEWPEHLSVAVNLSPAQFGKEGVAGVVAAALERSGLDPRRLQLEITESLLLQDSSGVMDELARLKALGAAIVMDDFGTGYSSLGYLWRFPFDKIKIDGSFMRAFKTADAQAEKIVRAIVTLGHTLGMRVCVEGVENREHAGYALAVGSDEVQGFHFGRPVPATDVAGVILADFRQIPPQTKQAAPGTRAAG
jgi:diguanylate cyclase (GGDEF)-like protein